MKSPSVILVDDHDLFRSALASMLGSEDITVVGSCSRWDQAVDVLRRRAPDVALTDTSTDDGKGLSQLASVTERFPRTRVIVLTADEDPVHMIHAFRSGAQGYLLKSTPLPELVSGIGAVAQGNACIAPSMFTPVVGFLRTGSLPQVGATGEMSERELSVLRLVARGMDNNDIAVELHISSKTVKNHVSNIFAKLGLQNRVQAAVYAVRSGLA